MLQPVVPINIASVRVHLASGRPSNRKQISVTADAVSVVSSKSGFTPWARSINNRIASQLVNCSIDGCLRSR